MSFSSLGAYSHSLCDLPFRLSRRAFSVSTTTTSSYQNSASRDVVVSMRKSLRWFDLLFFGLGGMLGAGVFVTTGRASHVLAGPSVVLSYAIAGLCALLSAFCYTEFAVHMPVAGGAFTYIRLTFGEFCAFITGANLVMDYVLSNAAVARSFTAYFATAVGMPTAKWRFTLSSLPRGFDQIDLVAVSVLLLITLLICLSTRESSLFNIILTALHLLFILFVIAMGFFKGDWRNLSRPNDPQTHASGFFPYGVSGMFNGAAMVYLSYIGYDAVSTMAEEVKDPVKDIPIGVSGSVMIVTVLYCLMAASMSMLVPYDLIDPEAPFSGAFKGGEKWVSHVIGIGASLGILTSLLVAMLGQARYMCVIGRSNVAPSWFARLHPVTSTPVNASAFLGIVTAAIALFTDLNILLNLVSIGTLFVFYMVASALIYHRYTSSNSNSTSTGTSVSGRWPTLSFLGSLTFTCIMFTLIWQLAPQGKAKAFMLGACAIIGVAILQLFKYMVPQARKPQHWGVPMMPWIPAVSIFLNIFLLGSLDGPSYVRFGFFTGVAVLVYVLYSVHASFDAETKQEEEWTSSSRSRKMNNNGSAAAAADSV